MRVRIDLKILIFLVLFYLTNQVKIYLTIMIFCLIHELGHIIAGLILKMKPEKIELMPYGLTVSFKVKPEDFNKKIKKGSLIEVKKIIVSAIGPVVSLILAILFMYIDPIIITKQDAVYSNILILLFNLIPIYPLDGGRIIKGILHIKFGNIISKKVINQISNIFMVIVTFICSIAVYYFCNIAYFLICIILWYIMIQENRKYRNDMRLFEFLESTKE